MKVRNLLVQLKSVLGVSVLIAHAVSMSPAQQANTAVLNLVNCSGTLADANGKPLSGDEGVTFYLYKDQQGGSPLWMEMQNVQPDLAPPSNSDWSTTYSPGPKTNPNPPTLGGSGKTDYLPICARG